MQDQEDHPNRELKREGGKENQDGVEAVPREWRITAWSWTAMLYAISGIFHSSKLAG